MLSLHPTPTIPAPQPSRGVKPPIGIRENRIAGGFIKISTHQLTMAWWLYRDGHITRRQLRIWFAAFEMAERRRHSDPIDGAKRPLYRVEEIARLVGGRGSETASAELRADVRALSRLGLVQIDDHAIDFAVSIDQIVVEDVSRFWTMFESIENKRRNIIVPRRTLRALAAGFSRAVTAVTIAMLIRSLYWHREQGDYRVDGRTKLSWVAEVFGISRRAATDAMAKLIDLGWLEPLPSDQWKLNRWGVHVRIVTDWKSPTNNTQAVGRGGIGESASPEPEFSGESATPDLNKSAFPKGKDLNTRRLGASAPNPAGFSNETKGGRKKKKKRASDERAALHNITGKDLHDTSRLLELYDQAVDRGLATNSEAGRLNFLALAERARSHGNNPPRLFFWLLSKQRFQFITQSDEDAAASRLRELRDGPCRRGREDGRPAQAIQARPVEFNDDERFVQACLQTAKNTRFEPFALAREAKGWSSDRWETQYAAYEQKDRDRWIDVGQ